MRPEQHAIANYWRIMATSAVQIACGCYGANRPVQAFLDACLLEPLSRPSRRRRRMHASARACMRAAAKARTMIIIFAMPADDGCAGMSAVARLLWPMRRATGIFLALALALQMGLSCEIARAAALDQAACCATECPMTAARHVRSCCASSAPGENLLAAPSIIQLPQASWISLGLARSMPIVQALSALRAAKIAPTASPPLTDVLCSRQN